LEVLINILLVALGFILLIKGADFLVNGASSLAKRFNVSDIAIGLTVVAMGTSAPELVVNIIAGSEVSADGGNDVVFGNIIGSNIFNTYVVVGIPALISPLKVSEEISTTVLPIMLVMTVLFGIMANNKSITRWEGIVLLMFYLIYSAQLFKVA